MTLFDWIVLAGGLTLLVIGLALLGRGSTWAQGLLLKALPPAGDRMLLALQDALPESEEAREKVREVLARADAEVERRAIALLRRRGYVLTKNGVPVE